VDNFSYIEKKYLEKIFQNFEELKSVENSTLQLLNQKSLIVADQIAKDCAECNKKINLILKKYYPEIKQLNDKLIIKSHLNFYFDFIDKLTDFIRNVENFSKLDDKYYDSIIKFIRDKENLISGKYRKICSQELTSFYDQNTRENLEKLLAEKLDKKSREFFTFGSLEEEIKKIAKIAGADELTIVPVQNNESSGLKLAQSIIRFKVKSNENTDKYGRIGMELENYLKSKKYNVIRKEREIITSAKLLPDI